MTEKKEISLYNGTVNITFYPKSHRYKLKDRKDYLVGVTTATGMMDKSRVLINWAVGLAGEYLRDYVNEAGDDAVFYSHELLEKIDESLRQHTIKKEKAADAGTMVHNWVEDFTKSIIEGAVTPEIRSDWPDEVLNGVNAFLDWYNENDVEFHKSERIVYSKKHEFVGTCDAVATVNGKKYMIDYKTSKGIYPEMFMQVAAYTKAYEEETKEKLHGALILKFGKEDGNFESKKFTRKDVEEDYKAFLSALNLKKWSKKTYGRK